MSYSVSTSFLLCASCPQQRRLLNEISLISFSLFFFSCPLLPSTLHVVTHLFCLPREEEEAAHLSPQPIKLRNAVPEGQHPMP